MWIYNLPRQEPELVKGRDLDAFVEFYHRDAMIIKLTSNFLVSMLSKLRSPQKYDIADEMFRKHLDEHIRLYASGQTKGSPPKRGKAQRSET